MSQCLLKAGQCSECSHRASGDHSTPAMSLSWPHLQHTLYLGKWLESAGKQLKGTRLEVHKVQWRERCLVQSVADETEAARLPSKFRFDACKLQVSIPALTCQAMS